MAIAVADTPGMTPAALRERYRRYALTIRRASAETLRKRSIYFHRLFAFLRFAYEEQFLARDLSGLVPAVGRRAAAHLPRALPETCIAALHRSIERHSPEGRRDAAIVCLLDTYGVRGAQIRALRLEHIDWERERIRFCACKGGRPIEQHLTAKAGNRLAEYIAGGRPPSSCPGAGSACASSPSPPSRSPR